MGARTDAARAKVVVQRAELADEVTRLEASGRAAVDLRAKIRQAPAKTAGLAAGTAFLLLGGPRRTFRLLRGAIRGGRAEMPKGLLPKDVEKIVRGLGEDGDRVRATLEREFAEFLESRRKDRGKRDLGATTASLLGNLLNPVTSRAGKRLAEQLFEPEEESYGTALGRIRARRRQRDTGKGQEGGGPVGPDHG